MLARTLMVPLILGSLTFGLAPKVARADIVSDEESVCRSQEAGASCELDGKAGKCIASKCHRNDYSDGPPPKSKQVDCMVCQPGEGTATPTVPTHADAKAEPTPDAKAEPTPTPTPSPTADAKPDAKPAATPDAKPVATPDAKPAEKADAKGDAKADAAKKSCAVANDEPTAWSLGVIGLVALALGRRKITR